MKQFFKFSIIRIISLLSAFLLPCLSAELKAEGGGYAATSMLSSGRWVKVNATQSGLHTISRQTLRNFGFSDPAKVYVYGYGGGMISEALTDRHPDDLPALPLMRGADGSISFYATGNIAISPASSSGYLSLGHTINPYTDTSYYFLSDRAPEKEPATSDLSQTDNREVRIDTQRLLVHEKDLLQCAESGRDYLGEDFRSNKMQNFAFDLEGKANEEVKLKVKFGAKSTAPTSILVSANGSRLAATSSDKIPAVTSSSQYYTTTITNKTANIDGESLQIGIEYSQAGVVSEARLDYIEVEYTHRLIMKNGQLQFIANPNADAAYQISGASAETRVWDITEPWNVKEVKPNFDAKSKTVTLAVDKGGLREFLAFEPSAKGIQITTRQPMANQDIHSLPTPEMLIVSPREYLAAAERIADIHRKADGWTVYVITPEKIYNEFSSGNADVSAFRKLNRMWRDRSLENPDDRQYGYCLLIGRPTYDQKRTNPETRKGYPIMPIWQSADALSETSSYGTDDFIGMVDTETSVRDMWKRQQAIAVGRYPVSSPEEALTLAEKLETYVFSPDYGVWRSNVMAIADDGDSSQHFNQSEKAIKRMKATEAGKHLAYEKLYLDAFELKQTGSGLTFPDAKERMLRKWEKEGVALINYIGHANPKEWGHEKLLTWSDINSMANAKLPIVYAATCSFGKWDAESVSGAEVMLSNPQGGAIAVITPSRTVYISPNEYITNAIADHYYLRDGDGLGMRLGDILRLGKNTAKADPNQNRYHLMGDPALRMPTPAYSIIVDSIAGKPTAPEIADAPSIKARSKVEISGRIIDALGKTADFNGPLQFTLFDAEKSVTTHGWGESGRVEVFQDQSSKLATGRVNAKGGLWKANIQLPAEISNNYSPAFLSLYAYDKTLKSEAGGSTDRLFVYGYDTSAAEDGKGPEIEGFGVNSLSSADNATVDPNPIVLAVFSDESGINISDTGIGHQITLTLDSSKEYSDVGNFYMPDAEIEGRGSIAYPLSDIEPGEHTLKLTVWDNANNSTTAERRFTVGINLEPQVTEFTTFYDRDSDLLHITVGLDRPMAKMGISLECFDLNGKRLWSIDKDSNTGTQSAVSHIWDLKDYSGYRLKRGIYIIKATIETSEGLTTKVSNKIAIPGK